MLDLAIFPTDLGWFGLLGDEEGVHKLVIGHASETSARKAILSFQKDQSDAGTPSVSDWNPRLRRQLERYAAGEPVRFDDCCIVSPRRTPFQVCVLDATRKIAFGETVTYGELADRVGSPRAARAVGTVMASNRVPIIIPCHRVVASGGKLGGFSAPQGVDLKSRMLAFEADSVSCPA